jgi:2-octaprenylphenol hydroxylase
VTFEVIVVGGGIVGLSAALDFAQQGIKTALIDRRPLLTEYVKGNQLADYDTRVSALSRKSQRFLQKLGVWESVLAERCTAYHRMVVWDGEGTASIDFDANSINEEDIGHIVENRIVANALYQRALHSDLVLFAPADIVGFEHHENEVVVHLADQSLSAGLLVAADGAQSYIRAKLGYFTREWDYGHSAIVATIETQHSHQNTAWQRFMHSGPLAFLPLDHPNKVSIVWSCHETFAQEFMSYDHATFSKALAKASEYCLGDVVSIGPRQSFPLRQSHAMDYIKQRCVLIGDAAHTIHPLAGQGMNLGLADAETLVFEVLRSKQRGLDVSHRQGLKRFQRQRKSANLTMMAAMEGFKRLFEARDLHVLWARNEGMKQLDKSSILKNLIVKHALAGD